MSDLTNIKGIGRRTAERMVLDLRDKVSMSAPAVGEEGQDAESGSGEEAVMALAALGMAGPAARQAVRKAIERNGAEQSVQQLIKQALKER